MQLADLMPDIAEHANDLQVLQLHAPARAGLRRDRERGGEQRTQAPSAPRRYRIYGELFAELSQKRY